MTPEEEELGPNSAAVWWQGLERSPTDRGKGGLAKVGSRREEIVAPPSPGPHQGGAGQVAVARTLGCGPQDHMAQQWFQAPTT